MFNRQAILQQVQYYDSFYLYDEQKIINQITTLKNNFRGVKFLYSIKTNANSNVVQSILNQGFGVDAASVAEVMMGRTQNIAMSDIQYSAPGKTEKNIRDTMEHATIIADSLNEMLLIEKVAKEKNMVAAIGVRINPNFSFTDESGMSSKFGIDETLFFDNLSWILEMKNIKIVGLHCHIRSQELNKDRILHYYKKVLKLAEVVETKLGRDLTFLNMGSGIGIPYETTDAPIDISVLGSDTEKIIELFTNTHSNTQIYIETGRYVVGESGVYVTKVLDKKVSFDKTYVILNNTLNGFLRPSMAQLIMKYCGTKEEIPSEPLYTSPNPSQIFVLNNRKEKEIVTLVGNLCTATDVVATDISVPVIEVGDVVVFTNAGSYSAVLSPMQFSSQVPPKELFLTREGKIESMREGKKF